MAKEKVKTRKKKVYGNNGKCFSCGKRRVIHPTGYCTACSDRLSKLCP